MRKIIKIFLASSIVEFANERMIIENFIRNISDKFEEHYDVKIQPLLCENFDDAFSKVRKQEEYNEKIRSSEFCFFIFFTKAGEYTREEFEVARKNFKEFGSPKIHTYFKVLKEEEAEQSLYDFMEELDKVFGHYYGTFDHIDTVKLRILLNLKLQEMDFLEIKADNGKCLVDGKAVMSLSNVSEFANNEIFKELQSQLSEVEEKYYALKAKYTQENCDEETQREYAKVASKRQYLIDSIEELQKNIFNMSLRMCKDEIRGEITQRQKEAYRLFEAGDIEGANRILDFAEIKNEYQRKKMIRAAEQKKEAQIFIRETKTKIEILKTITKLTDRFEEIEELYDEIIPEAFEYLVELNTACDYVWFLYKQNKHEKALEIGKQLEEIYDSGEVMIADVDLAGLYYNIAVVCSNMVSKKEEAEKYHLLAINIIEQLTKENPKKFNLDLADSYNNAGVFYADQGHPEKAERYYNYAIEIYEKLAKENPEEFNSDLAIAYNNAGVFYFYQSQFEKAEKNYTSAINIIEKLAKEKPERFNHDLANSYNNAGVFYKDQGQSEKAEKYYLLAIEIREKLAKDNPEEFSPDLALCYNNAGDFYIEQGQPKKAEKYIFSAINIYKQFAKENSERFNSFLALSYNNAGVFYYKQSQPEKAEEYYLLAIGIREQLAKENPERFNSDLADSYNNVGNFYNNQRQFEKAERYYFSAIEIYEQLTKENPERFNLRLAMVYNNAGIFLNDQGNLKKAEKYLLLAINIKKQHAKENPERFNHNLADSYDNAGILYANMRQPEKAEKYFVSAIEIYEQLAKENPERFNSDLIRSYNNYAALNKNKSLFKKIKEVAKNLLK